MTPPLMRKTLGLGFPLQKDFQPELQCTPLCRQHPCNWYLTGIPFQILRVRNTGNTLMEKKENITKKINKNENKKRKLCHYQVADRVLVNGDRSSKFEDYAYKGPYEIVEINNNGTVKIRKDSVTDVFT
eukprot:10915846-Ditylum_brightwellii.AAC.1